MNKNLICLDCKKSLRLEKDEYVCTNCKSSYPVLDGIPCFVKNNDAGFDAETYKLLYGMEKKLPDILKIIANMIVGRTFRVEDLLADGFDAVFVGTGAGAPKMMGIPGENLSGVYSGNEWLTRINLMRAHREEYATPIKVPTRVIARLPAMALSKPPLLPGGGVVCVNTAVVNPGKPYSSRVSRIQPSQNRPNNMVSTEILKATALVSRRRL